MLAPPRSKRPPRPRLIKPGSSCTCRASSASPTIWCGVRPRVAAFGGHGGCACSQQSRARCAQWVCAPVKPTLSAIADALCHPAWLARFAKQGLPRFESWAAYAGEGASARQIADLFTSQIPFTQTWRDLARLRELWPGKLIVKGILHEDDARRAVEVGPMPFGVKPRRQGAGQHQRP